ncbi:MAG TPA: N-acetylgalactosamine 6-sulfate sulfatase, partial [Verrucomicrobiales bacterium]|nr:N-acetylgalactosamine 6-sulfate sulfatase [Verrucomicrobiales bacterium]
MIQRFLPLLLFFSGPALARENASPNFILCMADDLGWGDSGFNGHPKIITPHLDDMAKAGVHLTRFYAGAPVCSPTRGSCLTGRNPFRYGVPTANTGHLR